MLSNTTRSPKMPEETLQRWWFLYVDVTFDYPGDICENTCGENIRDEDELPGLMTGFATKLVIHKTPVARHATLAPTVEIAAFVGCDNNSSTNMEDTLVEFFMRSPCWNQSISSSEPRGCARLNVPRRSPLKGKPFSIGGRCRTRSARGLLGGCNFDNLSAMGFSQNDAELVCDIFGCGIANLSNLEWLDSNPIRPSTNDMCIYYSPSRAGFSALDRNRNAIIVDRCSISDLF